MIGKKILHYKVKEKLGEGGMGIVYKAEDTKLNRLVAIKVLPPHLLVSEDDRLRFHREAKAAAALNHSNIATVYEINETDEKPFIVMEYVEGATLDHTIAKGPLKLEDAIAISIQIADGLDAAHKKGVVHRDIKASNILYSAAKKAKILDFGLAKTSMSTKLTQMGTTIGTVAYMSPEQIQGKEVDHRTDLWSLGVLLYEMIAGHLPFKADYDQAIFYSIQNENPDPLTSLRTGVPMALEWIVNKLMAKDPAERYQSANDLIIDLKAVDLADSGFSRINTTAAHTVKQKAVPKKSNQERMLWFGLVAILTVILILIGPWMGQKQQNLQVLRCAVDFTADGTLLNSGVPLVISPDGSKIVYVAAKKLYIRYVNDLLSSKLIPGTENAQNPSFSPDGNWIVYWADGAIKKVSLLGGKPQIIYEPEDQGNKTYQHWYAASSIIFTQQYHTDIFQISASGGEPTKLNEADSLTDFLDAPQVLPDGKSIILRRKIKKDESRQIVLFDAESREFTTLINRSGLARYASTGHILYGWSGDLLMVPFDADNKKVIGQAVPVGSGLGTKNNGTSLFAISNNGTLVYPQGSIAKDLKSEKGYLEIKDLSGNSETITLPGETSIPRISPDGRLCAFSVHEETWNVWIYDLKTKITSRLTDNQADDGGTVWSPDGKKIFFFTKRFTGAFNLASMASDGSGQSELLLESEYFDSPHDITSDGSELIFHRLKQGIFILPLNGKQLPKPFLKTPKDEQSPALSPDGKWIAYTSYESGQTEIYIRPFPGPAGFRQITTNGGIEPRWAPDGRTLYYRTNGGTKLYKLSFQSKPELIIGQPQLLFENNDWEGAARFCEYDISPDGTYFIMKKIEKSETVSVRNQFIVVSNWFEELKTKMTAEIGN